jgi:WD40 repeat protein
MPFRSRFASVPALFGGLVWVASCGAAAQPPKKGPTILTEPLALRAGEPLSTWTFVHRPPPIPGALSWTIETRRHRGYLTAFALTPDGKKMATGGTDGVIRLWDAESGEFLRALVGHASPVYGLAWSPDGHTLASAGSYDRTARLWDAATGQTLRILSKGHKGHTQHVAWSRDGKSLVVAGGASGFLTLWEVAKREPVRTSETGNVITGIAYGPDPKLVAVSGTGTGVQVWDVRAGKTPLGMVVPGQNATAVAWSPDGRTIAGGSDAKTFVWDADSGKEKYALNARGAALAFSPSGDALAVTTATAVKVWTAFDKDPTLIPLSYGRELLWAPKGAGLYGLGDVAVYWQPADGTRDGREIDAAATFRVQYTPGRPLVTGVGATTPQLWDVATGKSIAKLEGHTGTVSDVAWSKDGKLLATASADKSVRVWDATGNALRTLAEHEGAVQCVAWADNKTLASGSADKTVRVWHADADDSKAVRKHKGAVTAVAWTKDGKSLASGDAQRAVLVGGTAEADKVNSVTATEAVAALAWAPNGKSLAVGTDNGNVEVYAPAGGKLLQSYERTGTPPGVTALAWAPDGNAILSGRANFTAQVWPITGTKALFDIQCMAPVASVGWSPAGTALVISEADRAVRVHDFATGNLRASLVADGKQVAAVSAAGHYRVADEATSELVYVVQTAKGQDTLTPKEFVAKYKFANKPAAVVLTEK